MRVWQICWQHQFRLPLALRISRSCLRGMPPIHPPLQHLQILPPSAGPQPIRKRLRTSNLCKALHKQIRRRTRVAAIFPNPESCLRLVSAILMEIFEAWETSKTYLNPNLLK